MEGTFGKAKRKGGLNGRQDNLEFAFFADVSAC